VSGTRPGAGEAPLLHHERVRADGAAPERWILFLHGVYGAGRNWTTVARRVVRERPEWGAVLVDLRQHGGSTGFPGPHTMESAAADVERLARSEGFGGGALLGHSLGGKVAMVLAGAAARPPAQLWVVDSRPGTGRPAGSAWDMLGVLRRVPADFGDRGSGVSALEAEGLDAPVARWMATNLEPGEGGRYRWRIDPDDMEQLLRDFHATDTWGVLERPPAGTDVHVVKAETSSVLGEEACRRVEAAGRRTGRVHLHRVAGGHWLNADNPDALVDLLVRGLP